MDGTMSRDARNAETRTLLHRNLGGQWCNVIDWYDREFRRCAEGAIRLRSVTPHISAGPFGTDVRTDLVNSARAVAVRNHTRIRHPDSERVSTLLGVTRIDARGRDAYADFAGTCGPVCHFADFQHVASGTLLFVPRGSHTDSTKTLHREPLDVQVPLLWLEKLEYQTRRYLKRVKVSEKREETSRDSSK